MRQDFNDLVDAGDLNRLLREVDGLCERREFEDLLFLGEMCEHAVEQRGKQLWPIAEHIAYRVVLEGPPELAGPLVVSGAGRFAAGPLSEVAASVHCFDDIAPFLPSEHVRMQVAAERAVRGEDLTGRAEASGQEVPWKLAGLEPAYRLARYTKNHVEVEEPQIPSGGEPAAPGGGEMTEDDELEAALVDLVRPWTEESGGTAEAVVIQGGPLQAIGALEPAAVAARIDLAKALEIMAWAAASGGAHGRRRGAAYGRFAAWWTLAQTCDLPWPMNPAEHMGEIESVRWFAFEKPERPAHGWHLGIACSSDKEGWAWALTAEDRQGPE